MSYKMIELSKNSQEEDEIRVEESNKLQYMMNPNKIQSEQKDNENIRNYYTFYNLLIGIFKQLLIMTFLAICTSARFLLLLIFSNNIGLEYIQGVSAVIPKYSVLVNNVPWSTAQYFTFRSSYFFGKKEFRNIGLELNKAFLYNGMVNFFIALIFIFVVPYLLSMIFDNEKTIEVVFFMSRLMGIFIFFQFPQRLLINFSMSTKQGVHLPLAQVAGVVIHLLAQCIIILAFKKQLLGIGLSLGIGQMFVILINFIYFKYDNRYSETDLKFNFDETYDHFFQYVKTSIPFGFIVFINFISLDVLQFLSIMFGNISFTAHNLLFNLLGLLLGFTKSLTTVNNIELNKAKGSKMDKYFKIVIMASMTLMAIYCIMIGLILFFALKGIISLYSQDIDILAVVSELNVSFVLLFITTSLIYLLTESLSCFGNNNLPIILLICFRYIGTIALCFLFNYFEIGNNSFMISCTINNIFIIVISSYALYKILNETHYKESNID